MRSQIYYAGWWFWRWYLGTGICCCKTQELFGRTTPSNLMATAPASRKAFLSLRDSHSKHCLRIANPCAWMKPYAAEAFYQLDIHVSDTFESEKPYFEAHFCQVKQETRRGNQRVRWICHEPKGQLPDLKERMEHPIWRERQNVLIVLLRQMWHISSAE